MIEPFIVLVTSVLVVVDVAAWSSLIYSVTCYIHCL